MNKLPAWILGAVLALPPAGGWAQGGGDGPRLPCEGPPAPSYAEAGAPPAVQAWRGKAAQGWQPPGCSGLSTKGADIVVAVAGSFRHEGEIGTLLARIGAVSARTKVRYWSTTEKAWKPLVTEAFALSGPDVAQRRADFGAAQFAKGQPLYVALSDNRSSGLTVYRERVMAADQERLAMAVDNLTPMKMALITLFDPGDLQSAYFLARSGPGVWSFYSVGSTRMASALMPAGSDASYINRAVAFYRLVAGVPTDQEPPAAR